MDYARRRAHSGGTKGGEKKIVKIFPNFRSKKKGETPGRTCNFIFYIFLPVLEGEKSGVSVSESLFPCFAGRKIGGGKYEIDLSVRERDTSKADAPPLSVGELKHLQIRHKQSHRGNIYVYIYIHMNFPFFACGVGCPKNMSLLVFD